MLSLKGIGCTPATITTKSHPVPSPTVCQAGKLSDEAWRLCSRSWRPTRLCVDMASQPCLQEWAPLVYTSDLRREVTWEESGGAPVLSWGPWGSRMWDTERLCRWCPGHSHPHRLFVLFSRLGSLDLVCMNVPSTYSGVSSVVTSFCCPGV